MHLLNKDIQRALTSNVCILKVVVKNMLSADARAAVVVQSTAIYLVSERCMYILAYLIF